MMMHGCKGNVTMSVMTRVNKCDRIFFYLLIADIAHEDFFFFKEQQMAVNVKSCVIKRLDADIPEVTEL